MINKEETMIPTILLLSVCVAVGYSGGHSLRYYYTAVSDPGLGLPLFSIVGYVDDRMIDKYSSDIGRTEPVAQWMKDNEGPDYWERETQKMKGDEPVFKHNVKVAMDRYNQSQGFHSFQLMYGCELGADGRTRGYYQFGYDGREFIALDTERGVYVASVREAEITQQKWNSPEVNVAERQRNYLDNICIDWLKKYIGYGKGELDRKVRPQVKVSNRQSKGIHKLQCQVYGFYPREVDVKWVRNGKDDVPSEEEKQILPNPDGTYQIRVTVEVPVQEGENYACHVDHSSLSETLVVVPETKEDSKQVIIIAAVVAVVVLVLCGVIGFVVYKKRAGKRTPAYEQAAKNDSPASSITT